MDAGLDGSNAGTSLRASLLALNNPAKQQEKIMKKLGFSLTDSEGNAKSLSEIVGDLGESLKNETEAQKVATLGKLVGTEAVSGFLALMKAGPGAINKNTKALENSAGASKEAADKMMAGIGGALEQMKGAFESAAILIGDQLVPYIQKFAKAIGDLVDKFNNASPEFQKFVVHGAAIAAALALVVGPILILIGFIPAIVTGFAAIATAFTTVTGAIAVVTTGAAAATPAIGALAGIFTTLLGPVGLIIAALALITVGTIALVNHLSKDAIPEVDRFGKGVSAATKEALGGFFELSDGAGQALAELAIASGTVTEDMKNDIVGKYSEMNAQILNAMNERHTAQEASMQSFFLNSAVLTDEAEAAILQKQQNSNDLQVLSQESKEKRVKTILESASKEKRSLTQSEKDELNTIQQSMNENAVKYLTKNEVEQKVIMEKMKQSAGDLSAKQAAEVVKNSAKQRNEAVKEAEGQYDETVAEIIRMRDETGVITADQAKKMIAEATRAKDGAVKQAEIMHGDVVKEAKAQAGEHVESVNWETGEVLSKWSVFKNKVSAKWSEITIAAGKWIAEMLLGVIKGFNDIRDSVKEKMEEVKKKIENGWKVASAFLKGIDLKQIGKDIVYGLVEGIGSKFNDVKKKISELADSIPAWAKKVLGIHSPSRVMAAVGEDTVDGMSVGMKKSGIKAVDTIIGIAKSLVSPMKDIGATPIGLDDPKSIASAEKSYEMFMHFKGNGAITI